MSGITGCTKHKSASSLLSVVWCVSLLFISIGRGYGQLNPLADAFENNVTETNRLVVEGVVQNADGSPVETGVRVTIVVGKHRKTASTTTDGKYSQTFFNQLNTVAQSGDAVSVSVSRTGRFATRAVQLKAKEVRDRRVKIDVRFVAVKESPMTGKNRARPTKTSPPKQRESLQRTDPTKPSPPKQDKLGQKRIQEEKDFDEIIQSMGISNGAQRRLKDAGIGTSSDLRKNLKRVRGMNGVSRDFNKLRKVAILSLISQDAGLNAKLAKAKFDSVKDLHNFSVEELVKDSAGELDETQAIEFKGKIQVLHNLFSSAAWNSYAKRTNPGPLYLDTLTPGTLPLTESESEDGCEECDESNNLFSPAVYLLYLLDFVNESFSDELGTLDDVNERFYQNFADLSTSFDPSQTGSYVQLSNGILENLITELNDGTWPSENVEGIYDEFEDYLDEPGFNRDLLINLFDSYVRELGTTRREVGFINKGTEDLKEKFASEHNLDMEQYPTDLKVIDVKDEAISLDDIELLANRLRAFYQRKLGRPDGTVVQEFISDIEDEVRREFDTYFRQLRNDEVERIFDELTGSISVDNGELFNQLMDQAALCVGHGQDCPVEDPYEGNPISAIRELFKSYAEDYPIYTSEGYSDPEQFARDRFDSLYDVIKYDKYNELAEEQGIAPLAEASLEEDWEDADPDLKSQAETFSDERIRLEEEFDSQLHALAGYIFAARYDENITDYQAAFDTVVESRVEGQWETAVSRAELGFLSKIRTNLIILALKKMEENPVDSPIRLETVDAAGESLPLANETNIERLADYLHLDLTVDETYRTTPLSLAINRLHSFVQAVQLGTESTAYSMQNFNENSWGWLQSFGIWHAAMMVSAYPENFLTPEWRIGRTAQFQAVMNGLEDDDSPDLDSIVSQYADAIDEFRNMRLLKTVTVNDRIFIFAYPAGKSEVYYSVVTEMESWKGWEHVPADIDPHGRSPIEILNIDGFLHLFSIAKGGDLDNFATMQLNHMHLEVFDNQLRGLETSESDLETTEGDSSGTQSPQSSWSHILDLGYSNTNSWPSFAVMYQKQDETDSTMTLRVITQNPGFVGDFKIHGEKRQVTALSVRGVEWLGDVLLGSVENSPYALWERGGDLYLWGGPGGTEVKVDAPSLQYAASAQYAPSGPPINESLQEGYGGGFSPAENDFILYYRRTRSTPLIINIEDVVVRFYKANTFLQSHLEEQISEEQLTESLQVGQIGENIYMLFNPSDGNTEPMSSFRSDNITESTAPFTMRPFRSKFSTSEWDGQSLYYRNLRTFQQSNLSLPPLSVVNRQIMNMLHIGEINLDSTMRLHLSLMNENDDARIYLEEYYLHLPVMIATYLTENQRYSEAMEWLSKVYDPFQPAEGQRRVYSDFSDSVMAQASLRAIGIWLKDPFNPYLLSDLHKESHLTNVKLLHVKNFLDWADQLFTLDTSESVNRARELYEIAGMILGLDEWSESCHDFSTDRDTGTDTTVGELLEIAITDEDSLWDEDELLSSIPENALHELGVITIGDEIPALMPFCLPTNPMVNLLRWRIESNRAKIRTNRNFAGMKRELQHYATPVDPRRLVQQAASGGIDFDPLIPLSPPPVYRYSFLLERAKYLVSVAQQFENSMLSVLEKSDFEDYSMMKARQDIRLERSNVTLQGLRVKEASDSVKLAEKQKERAEFQQSHFDDLVSAGLLGSEEAALSFLRGSTIAHGVAAGFSVVAAGASSVVPSSIFSNLASASSSVAAVLSTQSSIHSTIASHERRLEEWKYQSALAAQDMDIADIGIDLAEDRVDIVEYEREIANLRMEYANDTVEFLGNKFTNRYLYRWMSKNLRKLYREQLNMAIATAKVAQTALEFERQTSLDFIGYDYWDSEKKGLLGAEQLLKDLAKMEQFRISSATRKKEIEKTISLASVAPVEFQRFKETGLLDFGTIPQWFERDFPAHYMRLIRDVNVSVLALIPPNEGIHATLSNPGISYVMVGAPFEERSVIQRLPESIAISSPRASTGLFELRADDPMLFPFEGGGVHTTWALEMDKGANRFDYNTIFDIYFTLRYTALEDRSYRDKVLAEMGQDTNGNVETESLRFFNLRTEFADQWYYFHNPVNGLELSEYQNTETMGSLEGSRPLLPYTMVIDLVSSDFVPNEKNRRIKNVMLAIHKSDNLEDEDAAIEIDVTFIPDSGSSANASLSLSAGETSAETGDMNGKRPYGRWILSVNYSLPSESSHIVDVIQDVSWLEDVLLVVEYEAKVHYKR